MITTSAILIVIATHITTNKSHYFISSYPSKQLCEEAKKRIKTRTYRTWRYCK